MPSAGRWRSVSQVAFRFESALAWQSAAILARYTHETLEAKTNHRDVFGSLSHRELPVNAPPTNIVTSYLRYPVLTVFPRLAAPGLPVADSFGALWFFSSWVRGDV